MALLHAGPDPATVKLTKINNNNNLKLLTSVLDPAFQPALKREHPALQKVTFIDFLFLCGFLPSWIRIHNNAFNNAFVITYLPRYVTKFKNLN
jgi:hypothetical protein